MRFESVIAVVSGRGGAGASVFGAVLAGCAAERAGHAFLLDCDPMGGGIDVLLGCERLPGPRWGQVRLRGGTLDPAALRAGLPCWQDVSFLAADTALPLDPAAVGQVIESARRHSPVILDLSRWPSPARSAALARCDRAVLVTAAEIRGVTASALLAPGLDPARTSVAIRGACRSLPAVQIGRLLGLPVLGELPYDPASLRPGGLDLRRVRRRTRRVAEALLAQLAGEALQGTAEAVPAPDALVLDSVSAA